MTVTIDEEMSLPLTIGEPGFRGGYVVVIVIQNLKVTYVAWRLKSNMYKSCRLSGAASTCEVVLR